MTKPTVMLKLALEHKTAVLGSAAVGGLIGGLGAMTRPQEVKEKGHGFWRGAGTGAATGIGADVGAAGGMLAGAGLGAGLVTSPT